MQTFLYTDEGVVETKKQFEKARRETGRETGKETERKNGERVGDLER